MAAANWPLCGSRRSVATRRRPGCTSPSTGGPVPVSVYAGMEPEAAAKAIWERIEAIRRKEPGR